MPVIERRRLTKTKTGSHQVVVPKGWTEWFGIDGSVDVDMIADTPVVVFPPSVTNRAERIDALKKIIGHLESVPERPFPVVKRGTKKSMGAKGKE